MRIETTRHGIPGPLPRGPGNEHSARWVLWLEHLRVDGHEQRGVELDRRDALEREARGGTVPQRDATRVHVALVRRRTADTTEPPKVLIEFTATAVCSRDDQFNRNTGATVVMQRLVERMRAPEYEPDPLSPAHNAQGLDAGERRHIAAAAAWTWHNRPRKKRRADNPKEKGR